MMTLVVERGIADSTNFLVCIVSHDKERNLFKIAVRSVVLNSVLSRTKFEGCHQALSSKDNIKQQEYVSLREAATQNSRSGEQGFVKCNHGANQCKNQRCKCYKAKLKYNSRCNSSFT